MPSSFPGRTSHDDFEFDQADENDREKASSSRKRTSGKAEKGSTPDQKMQKTSASSSGRGKQQNARKDSSSATQAPGQAPSAVAELRVEAVKAVENVSAQNRYALSMLIVRLSYVRSMHQLSFFEAFLYIVNVTVILDCQD